MRAASDFCCVFTGRSADHLHHMTGRGGDGGYLDPELVVPLSRAQHVSDHVCWRVSGIGEGADIPASVLRLRRSGHLLVRLAQHHAPGLVSFPAETLLNLGLMLHELAADWERDG